jgi:hypothetical protein
MTAEVSPYQLLPVLHRLRDQEHGEPLAKLLEPVEHELRRLEKDLRQLYDGWFVETCAEWLVPYLGDLLGVPALAPVPGGAVSQRAVVANTLRYRRRKGTPAALEQLARDVTGWPACVVEYFRLLGATQHLDAVRPGRGRTADLRSGRGLDRLQTPFGTAARTGEVRHVDVGRGRFDIPSVGIHLWRLTAYPVSGGDARAVDRDAGRWTFDPAGRDLPLFRRPQGGRSGERTREEDVPAPLRRRTLHRALHAVRDEPAERAADLLAEAGVVLGVRLDGVPVPPARLLSSDLTGWPRPAADADPPPVAVDPVLGRLSLPAGTEPGRVQVTYAYGGAGDVGAGPYDRRPTTADALAVAGGWPDEGPDWQVGVSREADRTPGRVVRSIGEALRLWETRTDPGRGRLGVIAVMDDATYTEDLQVRIPPRDRLVLVAASWPGGSAQGYPTPPARLPGVVVATGLRPHVVGTVTVEGERDGSGEGGQLVLGGLSVEGRVDVLTGEVLPGGLAGLVLANCTVLPDRAGEGDDAGWLTAAGNPDLRVRVLRSVCAGIRLAAAPGLGLVDSLLYAADRPEAAALAAPDTHVELDECTVFGRTLTRSLAASNSIMCGRVTVTDRQHGCVRYSYLPVESRTPRRYHCQPASEADAVRPRFTSTCAGEPGFGQLAATCPPEVCQGADDEGEMGAFHFLGQNRRVANLLAQVEQYLPFGLEAGISFET